MKTLADYMDHMLDGEIEAITVSELRSSIGDILTQASLGKSFCVKRKGTIVAFLVHPNNADVTHRIEPDGSCETTGHNGLGRQTARIPRHDTVEGGSETKEAKCDTCQDVGWVWGHELPGGEDPPTDQRYSCPSCTTPEGALPPCPGSPHIVACDEVDCRWLKRIPWIDGETFPEGG